MSDFEKWWFESVDTKGFRGFYQTKEMCRKTWQASRKYQREECVRAVESCNAVGHYDSMGTIVTDMIDREEAIAAVKGE